MAPVTAAGILDAPRRTLHDILPHESLSGDPHQDATEDEDAAEKLDVAEHPPMRMRQVMQWCMKGDSAIGRLDALCKFGPLVDGQLRAGFFKCDRAMSDAELRQMIWSEHATQWKALLPARHYLDDVVPLTLGINKGKSIYLATDVREILRESLTVSTDPSQSNSARCSAPMDGIIDFKKLQQVVAAHRRRRFRVAQSMVLRGGLLGSMDVFMKKVTEMSRPPVEKELTIAGKIDIEVAEHGGQVMMQQQTTRKPMERRQRHTTSNTRLASDELLTSLTTARRADNWWSMQVPRTSVKPRPADGA